ncbi:MAG: hypothetical protein EBR82_09060 [Caulobacteraceae bacterium]|nr:hypothetical protein [Caulobacteraceae bacterium]
MIGQDLLIPTLTLMRSASTGLSLDFTTGSYRSGGVDLGSLAGVPGWSFNRTGVGTSSSLAGVWASFSTGTPRITDRGLLLEASARTNKLTVYSANPPDLSGMTKSGDAAATLTRVSDAAALAAAGLSGLASVGQVWKLDNSGGASTANVTAAGGVGNTNPHSLSAWVRGTGSSVRVRLSSVNSTVFAPGGGYAWITTPNVTPTNAGDQWSIWCAAGSVAWFILPGLEEAATVSSPIVTAGAAATRGAESASVTVPVGCTRWTATWGSGATSSGSGLTAGAAFDLVSARPWIGMGNELKTLELLP